LEHHSRHESASLSTYLRVLRRRKWIVLVCVVLVPAAALFFSLRQPAQYEASADVLLSRQNLGNLLTGTSDLTFGNASNLTATQSELAHTPDVARAALALAKTSDLTADELLGSSTVSAKGTTDILEFRVTDGDPRRAELLATSFAEAYVTYREALDTRALAKARSDVTATLEQLRAQGRDGSGLFTSLEEKEQQLQTLLTLQTSQANVTRRADQATQVAPTPARNAILGLALGLVLGVGLAFAIDALDTRVRSAGEIGERLGLPLLARIPPPPRGFAKDHRLVMLAQPTGPNAEAFRMLRTNLEFARLERDDVRVILVTSAVEEEGKSTTAANLALAEARAGRRVALVDLDLRQPHVDRYFGMLHAQGITEVALGNAELAGALRRIDLATGAAESNGRPLRTDGAADGELGLLDVLSAGPLPPDPGEFVGTRRLAEILTRLGAAYDLVIVDTPPLLRVGDTMTLSAHADGMLVVTRLNVVRRPMLAELRRQLDTAPAPKLGYIVTGSGGGDSVGYGYGYGLPYGGYGYGDPDKTDRARGSRLADARGTAHVKEADRV
jgi:Mrp family chromosome partitioning ATPase/capsular polysaccharide biosynthesis protein